MKLKRILAVAMATTMVMAMSITALAEDTAPATEGAASGAGASEGHVEQKHPNVVLPTTGDTSTFAYTMDPERLISTTSAAKHANSEYPAAASDTGVYFNNGPKAASGADAAITVYANKSKDLTVTNKSSFDIDLTVTAEAEASTGGKDIPLVEKTAIGTATAAALNLGLIIDTGVEATTSTTDILSDAPVTKKITLAGNADNYFITVESGEYVYRARTYDEYKALDENGSKTEDDYEDTWKSMTFAVEGSATSGKAIADGTTAPTLKVTWSWVDPTAGPSITTKTATAKAGVNTDIAFSGVIADISDIKLDTTSVKSKTTITDGKITVLSSWTDKWTSGQKRVLTVEFVGGKTDTVEITKE
ncbi:hypothetical protein [Pseudobutyrivibrio xylanivorans]|uniref:Uncharacterized protein n=1 Tax=Pseudobutyrivibrio xylanivorans DSM 14809 TaxID=1123012 RepID=A0A1M6D907_PSEXY|nr:hypothetical protein [Pseudobutyrivibrio xylanivorans]SHI69693.1 hypothetical protein SAMN02745725_00894 [Pseudobutyrivibrio xylanivorans DSM 14809]